MTRGGGIKRVVLVLVLGIMFIIPFVSAAWWDNGWLSRKQVSITGGSQVLNDFTVLLKVDHDAGMRDDFWDLRFIDGNCSLGINELAYEFDKVVNSDYAFVWVKIPVLNTGTNLICMYYQNSGAGNGENISKAWDDNYVGIWHFKEGSGTVTEDSAGDGDGTFVGNPSWTEGRIGYAINFSGSNWIDLDENTGIKLAGAPMTIEAWGNANSYDVNLASIITGSSNDAYYFGIGGGRLVIGKLGIDEPPLYATDTTLGTLNLWTRFAITYSNSNYVRFFINKTQDSGNPYTFYYTFANSTMSIGGGPDYEGTRRWYGKLDEVKVSNIERSPAWLDRSYNNVNFQLFSFGEEEGRCFQNSDCGTNEWVYKPHCYNDNLLQVYRTYKCNYPNTTQAYCSYNDRLLQKQDCGEDGYSENYCFDNDVYRNFTERGCINAECIQLVNEDCAKCFESISQEKVVECENAGCSEGRCKFDINVISPIETIYNTKSILLNATLSETAKTLYYKINSGSWVTACSNCNKYSKVLSFAEGQNNLGLEAITYDNEIYFQSVSFTADTIKPKISSVSPSISYGNGLFGVKYTEMNLQNVTLLYGLNSTSPDKKKGFSCLSGANMWCYDNVDLSAYNGQYIYYKFMVKDKFFSTNSSKKKIKVDVFDPILNVYSPKNNVTYTNKDRNVYLNITSNEKAKLQYKDNNLAWVSLCSSCTYWRGNKKFSFGSHNVTFKATDLAGNFDKGEVNFILKQY